MKFPFVSRKKYEEMQNTAGKYAFDYENCKKSLYGCQEELRKQTAVNEALQKFQQSFKEFYEKVTHIPVITKISDKAVTLTTSTMIDQALPYSHMVDSMKSQMIYELAQHLQDAGLVNFELVDDRSTGRAAYKATITVVPVHGGEYRSGY